MIRILGVSCYFHDSAAALLEDGNLIAAAEEERFTRVKHDYDFPEHAIAFCLRRAGIKGTDLDYVVFFEKPFLKLDRILKTAAVGFPRTYAMFTQSMRAWLFEKLWVKSHLRTATGIPAEKVLFSQHHLSHAASAYFCSPFDEAAVITFDGVGEWSTTTIGVGRGTDLRVQREIRFPHSIGLLYSAFTAFLGFEVNEGEYKVMGMASYGRPRYVDRVREIVRQYGDGSIWLDMRYLAFHRSSKHSYSKRFVEAFGEPRQPHVPFFTEATGYPAYYGDRPPDIKELIEYNQHYADIAASVQKVTEELILGLVNFVHRETGMTNLCLAGGVALNSVANGRIRRETPFTDLYIQPSAGDGGGALGAALLAWHHESGGKHRFVMDHAYWGEDFDDKRIASAFEATGADARRLDDPAQLNDAVVERLGNGKVIGWFQGRFEWGPRALGNRSILADPTGSDMKDIVNGKIKFREPFRPFAPAILKAHADHYFDMDGREDGFPERFMLTVVPVRDSVGDEIPAVNHMGTARVQVVDPAQNPRFGSLLEAFHSANGVPLLLNTSFNVKGEPIVSTPENALATFHASGLDTLIMGDYLLDKVRQT